MLSASWSPPLFCGMVHCVVDVELPEPPPVVELPEPPPVFEDAVVGGVVVLEFELVDGDELPQAARPNARATEANPNNDFVFRLVPIPLPLGACRGDISAIRGPRSDWFPGTTSEGVDLFSLFTEFLTFLPHWSGDPHRLPHRKLRLVEHQSERRSRTWWRAPSSPR